MDTAEELQRLWTRMFGEPPSIRAAPEVLAGVLVAVMPAAPPYRPAGGGDAGERFNRRVALAEGRG